MLHSEESFYAVKKKPPHSLPVTSILLRELDHSSSIPGYVSRYISNVDGDVVIRARNSGYFEWSEYGPAGG